MKTLSEEQVIDWLRAVKDPEIPVVDVVGMGIVRGVALAEGGVRIRMTPTYSGCPAMEVIEREIVAVLTRKGIDRVRVQTEYAPAWTTDWIDEDTRRRLKAYGIAPPQKVCNTSPFAQPVEEVSCPRCDSREPALTSRFGSTACKALYYCPVCDEPFEQFKCI